METILNKLNKVESAILILWALSLWAKKHVDIPLEIPIMILSFYLAAFYLIQGKRAVHLVKESKPLIQSFPLTLGLSSSLLVLGVLIRVIGMKDSFMATTGMVGLLISCLLLFHNPIQDEFLPVLKKIILRVLILIVVGFSFSF